METIGNTELLNLQKTAFFAPGKISVGSVLPCYDWANQITEQSKCVVSSFKSKLERDVWNFLVRGAQPIIIVMARKKHSRIPQEFTELLDSGRLLIIYLGLCDERDRKANIYRSEYIAEIADQIVFASITPESSLYPLFLKYKQKSTVIYK